LKISLRHLHLVTSDDDATEANCFLAVTHQPAFFGDNEEDMVWPDKVTRDNSWWLGDSRNKLSFDRLCPDRGRIYQPQRSARSSWWLNIHVILLHAWELELGSLVSFQLHATMLWTELVSLVQQGLSVPSFRASFVSCRASIESVRWVLKLLRAPGTEHFATPCGSCYP